MLFLWNHSFDLVLSNHYSWSLLVVTVWCCCWCFPNQLFSWLSKRNINLFIFSKFGHIWMSNCYVFICLCIGISCMHVLGNGSINLMKQITLSTKKNVAPFLFFSMAKRNVRKVHFVSVFFVCLLFIYSLATGFIWIYGSVYGAMCALALLVCCLCSLKIFY